MILYEFRLVKLKKNYLILLDSLILNYWLKRESGRTGLKGINVVLGDDNLGALFNR